MSQKKQATVSRLVYDVAEFEWKIENFIIDKIAENDEKFLVSPPFNHSGIDWYLKIIRKPESLGMRLFCCDGSNLSGLYKCQLRVFRSRSEKYTYQDFKKPIRVSDLWIHIQMSALKDSYLNDNSLRVSFELTMEKLVHDPPVQPMTNTGANEEEKFSQRGLMTLAKSIGSILEELKFSDVTLETGEDTFQAHRAILASRSKVFDGMFESGMKESQEGVVQMVEMKPGTAKEMLHYIYTGKIEALSMDRAMDLYVAADRYDLQELRGWCRDFIVKHVSVDNVCDVAVLGNLHGDKELTDVARGVFKRDSKTIVMSQAWKEFAKNSLSVYMNFVESTLTES